MTREEIQAIQRKIGTVPDGIFGPKSREACKAYLRGLMPKPNPWPSPDDASMIRFYGAPGDEKNLVSLNVAGLGIKYSGQPVSRIRCHDKVVDSLLRVLTEISKGPGAWVLGQYAGCYNDRAMRGGHRKSKHAWGVAIDLAPGTNGLRTSWPQDATMPFEVLEAFAREGWQSAAGWWTNGHDAMHHEATKA
jgi:hypothetical protein